MDRRQFTRLMIAAVSLAPFTSVAQAVASFEKRKSLAEAASIKAHQDFMGADGIKMMGNEKIAMLLYPGFYAADLVNPQFIFSAMMGSTIYLVSPTEDLTPVEASGIFIVPTHKQSECPDDLDILFIPGGALGTLKAMQNEQFIAFIKAKAAKAKYITSVCTGSLLLAKAGLLKGKKATSHWSTLDVLAKFGTTAVKKRVVWDGNIVTGGGVTAVLISAWKFWLLYVASNMRKRFNYKLNTIRRLLLTPALQKKPVLLSRCSKRYVCTIDCGYGA